MADVFSKSKRSEVMRAVKSRGNKSTELKLIEIFKTEKIIGWRRNYKLFGKPDFVFPKKRLAIFVTAAFGTDTIVEIRSPPTTRIIGGKKSKEIEHEMSWFPKLLPKKAGEC